MHLRPTILREGTYTDTDLHRFIDTTVIWKTIDIYQQQLAELFEITHPDRKFTPYFANERAQFIAERTAENANVRGNWLFFPWSGTFIHTVNETDYFALRTNRNKQLITTEEQEKLYNSCVGFLGLSIGAHMASALTYTGIAKTIKLAEFDTLETSNLNRLQAGLQDIGRDKMELALESIYAINPYADPILFAKGLNEEELEVFVHASPKPQIIFEAVDDFVMKIKIRLEARKAGIPVIMLTNLGDNLLVDVERYDLDPHLPLFNGLIGTTPEEILSNPVSELDKVKYAMKIVGTEHLSARILETLLAINKTLVGRPQLYSTVAVGGGFAGYLARQIILRKPLKSGRTFISFNNLMQLPTDDNQERQAYLEQLKELLA